MTILANTPAVRRLGYSGLAAVASVDCAAPALPETTWHKEHSVP